MCSSLQDQWRDNHSQDTEELWVLNHTLHSSRYCTIHLILKGIYSTRIIIVLLLLFSVTSSLHQVTPMWNRKWRQTERWERSSWELKLELNLISNKINNFVCSRLLNPSHLNTQLSLHTGNPITWPNIILNTLQIYINLIVFNSMSFTLRYCIQSLSSRHQ